MRLAVRVRRGKFGSRLLIKLAGIFALVGLLPGLVIYTVSYQFANRSIAAWFDVNAWPARWTPAWRLGKGTLDTLTADLVGKARIGAERLADAGTRRGAADAGAPARADRRQRGLAGGRQSTARCCSPPAARPHAGPPERPSPPAAPGARQNGTPPAQVEGLDDESLAPGSPGPRVRALARVPRSQHRPGAAATSVT